MSKLIRVLVVDDSALARKFLSDKLNDHPDIEVVGTANDGQFVLSKIQSLQPDIITLDVEMRTMGGLEVLPQIVKTHNLPVIMVSAHTDRGAQSTVKALELGAVDFVTKPQALGNSSVEEICTTLTQKILAIGKSSRPTANRSAFRPAPTQKVQSLTSKPAVPRRASGSQSRYDLISIGASTGGTEAIKNVLINLPNNLPGIVIVQHMPAGFTKAFSNRLDSLCNIHVKEAEDGDEIATGTALIAPGSHHMEVVKRAGRLTVRILDTPPVNRHKPSVDVLFFSIANQPTLKNLGIILTGMGADGAKGMRAMHDTGSLTIAQDEQSCVVFGMPKEAIKCGGASHVMPLDEIAPYLVSNVMSVRSFTKMASFN